MRRPNGKTRQANQSERNFQGWLKEHVCCVSGDNGVEVHHCEGSTFRHNKVLIGHWFCIPLTTEKHKEYHSGTRAFRERHGMQADLWMNVYQLYKDDTGKKAPLEVVQAIADWGR